jgi:hypothetical protein
MKRICLIALLLLLPSNSRAMEHEEIVARLATRQCVPSLKLYCRAIHIRANGRKYKVYVP